MNFLTKIKNTFLYPDTYRPHPEAVIISCYFNPQGSAPRKQAFDTFYESIKHLNHRIVECVIGNDKPQIYTEDNENITLVRTKNLLWHKEALLNGIIKNLPDQFKYVFWVDADVIFTNLNWVIEGVQELQHNRIVQPFEYCVHLDEHETAPCFDVDCAKYHATTPSLKHPALWRSFASCHSINISSNSNYDIHGHVGFAWGARKQVLLQCPLYDKALIGGADHIIAHAAAGHIPHSCITKSFTEDIDAVLKWSREFSSIIFGQLGYVKGDLYHLWHGEVSKRDYFNRVKQMTPLAKKINRKDDNGLYETDDLATQNLFYNYFTNREVSDPYVFGQHKPEEPVIEFGGGHGGGAGSGGSWEIEKPLSEPQQQNDSNNDTTPYVGSTFS